MDASIPISGHTVKTKTTVIRNDEPEFIHWVVSTTGIQLAAPQNYDDNRLIKQEFKDPQWTSGKAGTSIIYTDQRGHVRLKRNYIDETNYQETSYLYNIAGQLLYVIPPTTPHQTIHEGDGIFEKYLYVYRYDEFGRLIASKQLQKDWSYFVYDKLDRLVVLQDALQLEKGKWFYIKYDKLGREVITGVFISALTRSQLQEQLDSEIYFYE